MSKENKNAVKVEAYTKQELALVHQALSAANIQGKDAMVIAKLLEKTERMANSL